jgi:hypothetical protein
LSSSSSFVLVVVLVVVVTSSMSSPFWALARTEAVFVVVVVAVCPTKAAESSSVPAQKSAYITPQLIQIFIGGEEGGLSTLSTAFTVVDRAVRVH